jgi:hypothetical protein
MSGECGALVRGLGLEAEMTKHNFPVKRGLTVYGTGGKNAWFVPVMGRDADQKLFAQTTWQVRRAVFDKLMLDAAVARGAYEAVHFESAADYFWALRGSARALAPLGARAHPRRHRRDATRESGPPVQPFQHRYVAIWHGGVGGDQRIRRAAQQLVVTRIRNTLGVEYAGSTAVIAITKRLSTRHERAPEKRHKFFPPFLRRGAEKISLQRHKVTRRHAAGVFFFIHERLVRAAKHFLPTQTIDGDKKNVAGFIFARPCEE